MNRTVKFRAWDRKQNKMSFPYGFIQTDAKNIPLHQPLWFESFDSLWNLDIEMDKCDLMQFTGLLDKNGKEIYEGDIIKGWHDFGPGGEAERTGVIGWNGDGYGFNYWRDLEIIGNIHEQPELLK